MLDTNPIMNPSAPLNLKRTSQFPWSTLTLVVYATCVLAGAAVRLYKLAKKA